MIEHDADKIMGFLIKNGRFVQTVQNSSEVTLDAIEELRNAGFMTLIYDGPDYRIWRAT